MFVWFFVMRKLINCFIFWFVYLFDCLGVGVTFRFVWYWGYVLTVWVLGAGSAMLMSSVHFATLSIKRRWGDTFVCGCDILVWQAWRDVIQSRYGVFTFFTASWRTIWSIGGESMRKYLSYHDGNEIADETFLKMLDKTEQWFKFRYNWKMQYRRSKVRL